VDVKANVKAAWEEPRSSTGSVPRTPPGASIAEKTKKHVGMELSLFSVVCLTFILFNVYYWTRPREY
jgi:hypothetical protein